MTYPVDQPQPPSGVPERGSGHRASALEAEDGRSIGELLSDVSSNLSTLMRQEVALAKAEVRQSGRRTTRVRATGWKSAIISATSSAVPTGYSGIKAFRWRIPRL